MQMSMLIRQLDGFGTCQWQKVRANSNSNSKLELDDFEPSFQKGNGLSNRHQI